MFSFDPYLLQVISGLGLLGVISCLRVSRKSLRACCRYVPVGENCVGVELTWEKGDKTLIQVDHSSITPENGNCEVMTVYRFLTHLERVKKITEYKLSYTECERKPASSDGTDSFTVNIKDAHKYRVLADSSGSSGTTCKSFFAASVDALNGSDKVTKVFRWRFERTWACCKVQKPYVMTTRALQLKANAPAQIV